MLSYLKRLWMGETEGLAAGAAIVAVASFASRLLGVIRDRLLASHFGASVDLDAYYAAFRLPDMLYNLFIVGALSAGFIPLFTEYWEKRGRAEAIKLAGQIFSFIGCAMLVLCLFLMVGAHLFVPWTVPGFSAANKLLTIHLSQIMFGSSFFLGLSAVMGGVLQSTKRFLAFSLAPILYNVGIILGIFILTPVLGVYGLAWGVVLGAVLHFLAQATVAFPLGLRQIPWPSWKPEGVRRMMSLMIPRTASLAVSQVNLVIILIFASTLPIGSVAVFNLANNLQSFPLGLVGISFAVAAFPVLSRAVGRSDQLEFQRTIVATTRKILFFILPILVLFLLLRAQMVRVILGQGKFDWDDTRRTLDVFALLALSLPAQCLSPLLIRGFYAFQDTWRPFWIGVCSEFVNFLLAWWLHRKMGIQGLAMAFSVAAYVNVGLLLIWLMAQKRLSVRWVGFGKFVLPLGVATASLAGGCILVRQFLGVLLTPLDRFWEVALQGGLAGLTGILAFCLVMRATGSIEWQDFSMALRKRLGSRS